MADKSDEELPIPPLKLVSMNGPAAAMERIGHYMRNTAIAAATASAIGAAGGAVAGDAVQDVFRDKFNYHPDALNNFEPEGQGGREGREGEISGGILGQAKKRTRELLRGAQEAVEETAIMQKYREAVRELQEIKKIMLETGDMVAFWAPFILAFLALTILTYKIIRAYIRVSELTDPILAENMKRLADSMNMFISEVNQIRINPPPSGIQEAAMNELQEKLRRMEVSARKAGVKLPE